MCVCARLEAHVVDDEMPSHSVEEAVARALLLVLADDVELDGFEAIARVTARQTEVLFKFKKDTGGSP